MNSADTISLETAILVGGRSRRMGRDKAMIHVNGEVLWQRQARLAKEAGALRVFVSVRPDQDIEGAAVERVADARADLGPLSGIAASLAACTSTHLMILAVDMPALTAGILREILVHCELGFGVIPHTGGAPQPLAAVYTRDCLAPAERRLAEGALSVRAWAAECLRSAHCVRWDVPEPDVPLFANWNSPEDVPRAAATKNPIS